jgi:hypothetical protein
LSSATWLFFSSSFYPLSSFFANTPIAEDVQDDPLVQDPKPVLNILGHFQFVVTLVVKVDDLAAPNTMEVVVLVLVGVESPRPALPLHDINETDSSKGEKGPIDGIKRHARENLFDKLKHRLSRGMFFRLAKFLVDSDPLRCDPEVVLLACFLKEINKI